MLRGSGLRQPDDIVNAVGVLASEAWVLNGTVGLLGVSQGGQVALLAAARGAPVRAVWRATTSCPGIVSYIDAVCGTDTRRRSPVNFAGDINAPVLLVHGDADAHVPTEQSDLMAAAFAAVRRRR